MNARGRFDRTHGEAAGLIPEASGFAADSMEAHRCRLAFVYAVAAMDGYFTGRFMELLDGFLAHRGVTTGLARMLREAGVDVGFFLTVLKEEPLGPGKGTDGRPCLVGMIRDRIEQRLTRLTCQSVSSIDRLYAAYDLPDLCERAMARARTDGLLTGIRTPLARLERLVERRHRIVHAGDLNAHDRPAGISAGATAREMRLVRGFVTGAERVVSERFGALLTNASGAECK